MKTLIGVVQTNDGEQLFILEQGLSKLIPADKDSLAEFGNYTLLRDRPLNINDQPISGEGVFRFRYGPVTSGLREAGCFYLYTYGEKILRASIDLNWKHRGVEQAMVDADPARGVLIAENVCSNFAMAHSVAYCRAVEEALGLHVSLQTKNWRILLLECERIYNHLYVIYRLASAAAQKVLASHLSALFEEALRLNQRLTGFRFLQGINHVGALEITPDPTGIHYVVNGYKRLTERFTELYTHSLANSNYLDRLHAAGVLSSSQAVNLGLTGPSLRACGVSDTLNGTGMQHTIGLPVVTQNEGDALARMEIRSAELVNSCQYVIDHLKVSDTWKEEETTERKINEISGRGCGIANSASGAVGYYAEVTRGRLSSVGIFTPSYPGMHAISAALQDLVFTDFPFVFDSFGVHFTEASR